MYFLLSGHVEIRREGEDGRVRVIDTVRPRGVPRRSGHRHRPAAQRARGCHRRRHEPDVPGIRSRLPRRTRRSGPDRPDQIASLRGSGRRRVSTCIDVSDFVDQKIRATAAHRSQYPIDPDDVPRFDPPGDVRRRVLHPGPAGAGAEELPVRGLGQNLRSQFAYSSGAGFPGPTPTARVRAGRRSADGRCAFRGAAQTPDQPSTVNTHLMAPAWAAASALAAARPVLGTRSTSNGRESRTRSVPRGCAPVSRRDGDDAGRRRRRVPGDVPDRSVVEPVVPASCHPIEPGLLGRTPHAPGGRDAAEWSLDDARDRRRRAVHTRFVRGGEQVSRMRTSGRPARRRLGDAVRRPRRVGPAPMTVRPSSRAGGSPPSRDRP